MVKAMKRQMRYMARNSFVRGLSSLLDVGTSHPRRYSQIEAIDALRSDMEKIGADMYRVIERETANEKAAARKAPPAAE
jgi:hypothetical protein